MIEKFERIKNAIDYTIRQRLHWKRAGLKIKNEEKFGLYSTLPEIERNTCEQEASRIRETYHLKQFFEFSSRTNYSENLFYLEMLERALGWIQTNLADDILIADIGPSSWFYIYAFQAFFRWWKQPQGRKIYIEGYEADPYRVYSNFYSRYDHARAYMAGLNDIQYLPYKFTRQTGRFDVITMLFPFVFEKDHRKWGLPQGMFQPKNLLGDAWDSLKPGGILIVVNQGEDEQKKELAMMAEVGVKADIYYCHDSYLFQYESPRFVAAGVRNG